jgi:HK97 gp10 family phage protein
VAKGGAQLFGDKALARTFRTLGDRVKRKVLRQSVNAAGTPVVKAARTKAPDRSGLTKKSLGKKLKTYAKTGTVVGIIGPRTSVVGEVDGRKHWPAKIAHLVEKGHINRDGSFTPPHPFLGPAFDESQGEAAGVMRAKLAEGVMKEAARGAKS